MFNGALLRFQREHEENLLKACADNQKLILQAPTGSGKTVLVTKFIDDYLDENLDTVFIWLCPGAGSLQDQSRSVFESLTSGIPTGSVYDFITEPDPCGNVYFINWDKITKSTNIVNSGGENKTLDEKIIECRMKGLDFFMIIDEEHMNKAASELYERNIAPKHILRISATTKSKDGHIEKISDDEVIASGLIASGISINERLSREAELNDNFIGDLELLKLANEKRKQIDAEYAARGCNIRCLVLVQFPNGSEEWIARVKAELKNLDTGYTEKNGLVTSWFSGDHPDDPEEIRKLNGKYAFLLFKQAIATGWDCPRAKILVKLREGSTETFEIQTIGRIRRMPERRHYESDLLDHCYIYTLDQKFKEGLTASITDSFYLSRYRKKENAPSIILEKEFLEGSGQDTVNEEAVVKALYKELIKECDTDENGLLSRREMELSKGFVFGLKLKTRAVEGIVRTTNDISKLQATFCGEHEINIHDDGLIIRDAKRKIAQSIGINETIVSKALGTLFDASNMTVPFVGDSGTQLNFFSGEDDELEVKYKVLRDMGHREFNAFIVNNWELLADMLSKVDANDIEIIDTDPIVEPWGIPKTQDYKKHRNSAGGKILEKNVFEGYSNDLLVQPNRSLPEITFENWCENYQSVEWVYKNGDKGKEFFTIIYRTNYRNYNFYPDYILRLANGETWIIEVKGGSDASGETQNRDKYAAQKLDALRKYGERHPEIHWGFVRNFGNQLYISNTVWDESLLNSEVWKPIEDVIK